MDSRLQVISGKYRGRKLALPRGARPTQNRARIALFNMLESGIIEPTAKMNVWDVFAGSGAFGVECISRYANSNVIFTDVAPESVAAVRKNVAAVSADAQSKIIQTDAIAAIGRFGADSDLVFVDCPYDSAEIGRAFVNKLGRVAKRGAILVWEQEAANAISPNSDIWNTLRDKTYGRARFVILQKI